MWTGQHWKGLILVAYDTSLRIGCLLKVPRDCLQGDQLTIPAELQKARVETVQRLHPETVAVVEALPPSRLLFNWPYHDRHLWTLFRSDILEPAGLASTRRDCFHKIRRTSYTRIYDKMGLRAASEHAAHSTDMSRWYLDKMQLTKIDPIAVLPRPGETSAPASAPGASGDHLASLLSKLGDAERAGLMMLVERLCGVA